MTLVAGDIVESIPSDALTFTAPNGTVVKVICTEGGLANTQFVFCEQDTTGQFGVSGAWHAAYEVDLDSGDDPNSPLAAALTAAGNPAGAGSVLAATWLAANSLTSAAVTTLPWWESTALPILIRGVNQFYPGTTVVVTPPSAGAPAAGPIALWAFHLSRTSISYGSDGKAVAVTSA